MGNAHIFRQLKSIQKKASSGPHLEIRPQLTADNGEASEDEDGDDYVDPRSFWCHILTLYSQRNLSYVQDRLPAIGGLVRCVQIELGDTYYAGLWRNGLMRGLLWYSVDDKGEISSEYIGPSWSWVPVDSNLVKWKETTAMELATITDVHLEYESPDDRYGRVKDGRLTITAPYPHLAVISEDNQHNSTSSTHFQQFINQVFEEDEGGSRGLREFRQQHRPCPGQHFAALQVLKGIGIDTHEPFVELLLLESADDHSFVNSDGENEVPYRRIGQVFLRKADSIDEKARASYFMIGPVEDAAWHEAAEQW
jgi:hypothetical protein